MKESYIEKKERKRKEYISKHINKKEKPNSLYFDKKDFDELNIQKKNYSVSRKELELINQENYIISKPNDIIQNTIFDFNITELKCLNYCICKLAPNKNYELFEKNGKYWHLEFKLQEILDALKLSGSNAEYKNIKNSLYALKKEQKIVKFIEKDGEKEKEVEKPFNYFLDVEIVRDKKEGVDEKERGYSVRIQFDGNLINTLQHTKNRFTEITQVYSSRISKKYSIRLYELCKSWESHKLEGYKDLYGFTFYIDRAMKEWFIPDYYEYKVIKSKIINPAIDEINKKTDIWIDIVEVIKSAESKKTIGLKLSIKPNPNFVEIYKEMEKERKEYIKKKYKKTDKLDKKELEEVIKEYEKQKERYNNRVLEETQQEEEKNKKEELEKTESKNI